MPGGAVWSALSRRSPLLAQPPTPLKNVAASVDHRFEEAINSSQEVNADRVAQVTHVSVGNQNRILE